HAHLRATERKDHWHAHCWTRAGIKIGCEANDSPGFDQFARRCVMIEPQVEAASGKQSANHIRKREGAYVRVVDLFKMVRAGCLHLDRQSRCTRVRKLFGMQARDQAAGTPSRQNLARLRY